MCNAIVPLDFWSCFNKNNFILFCRANRDCDKDREALVQQAIVKKKKGFKPEYNPLMGGGGSSGYRPSKKTARTGGGWG